MRPLKDRRAAPRKSPATPPSSTRSGRVEGGEEGLKKKKKKKALPTPAVPIASLPRFTQTLFGAFCCPRRRTIVARRADRRDATKPPEKFPGQLPFIPPLKHQVSFLRAECMALKPPTPTGKNTNKKTEQMREYRKGKKIGFQLMC